MKPSEPCDDVVQSLFCTPENKTLQWRGVTCYCWFYRNLNRKVKLWLEDAANKSDVLSKCIYYGAWLQVSSPVAEGLSEVQLSRLTTAPSSTKDAVNPRWVNVDALELLYWSHSSWWERRIIIIKGLYIEVGTKARRSCSLQPRVKEDFTHVSVTYCLWVTHLSGGS